MCTRGRCCDSLRWNITACRISRPLTGVVLNSDPHQITPLVLVGLGLGVGEGLGLGVGLGLGKSGSNFNERG